MEVDIDEIKIKNQFFSSCSERGYPNDITAEVWRQIESFAGYSFSKGHSASYAVESYQSLFLKAYYPREFMVGVINNFGGFYRTEFYVHEARMCGAAIHAPCINRSDYLTNIQGNDIYLGFIHLAGLEQQVATAIVDERDRAGEYISLDDLSRRVEVPLEQLRLLVRIGAFRFTGRTKKQLLWDLHLVVTEDKKTMVRHELFETAPTSYALPELYHGDHDDTVDEIELLGFPLSSPFDLIKSPDGSTMLAKHLPEYAGRIITITGYLVTSKFTATVKRETMVFGTFIDREGRFFDTTHFPKVAAQYPLRGRGCYRIQGKVDEEFGFFSITVHALEKLETKL